MTTKSSRAFLFCGLILTLLFLPACGPLTPIAVAPTACPPENWPCPSDSLTLTAVMESTLAATPGFTPAPFATITLMPGDLGWGEISGKVLDATTGLPIPDALVKCEHLSYTSPYRCNSVIGTPIEGFYSFGEDFFHDTDRIILTVEARGYAPLRFEQSFFTQPGLHADLKMSPLPGNTPAPTYSPEPLIMCTAPACPGGNLACGKADGCLGGCGTICLTATP